MADVLQQLPALEAMCERLYTSQDQGERAQVEAMLARFGQSTEYVGYLKTILDNTSSPYAQYMAVTALLKLVTEHSLPLRTRTDMKSYFLSYLDSKGAVLQHFVVVQLVQLLCRTVKLGWFEVDAHKAIVEDCKALMEKGSTPHYLLALRILNTLVQEMNSPTPGRTLTQHRKAAVNFRDSALLRVFTASLAALRDMAARGADDKLKEQGLTLCSQCLSFDFVGTCLDDASEELCTIQVPTSWRGLIEDAGTVSLLLEYYQATTPPLSNTALECLVRLASVRRSLFSSDLERSRFLNRLVAGSRDIMRKQAGLADHDNYHEFCRLLGRLKTNYQLSELVAVEHYTEWIQQVAELTIRSLNSWQWAATSVFYLLGLWSRLVSSMPYLKGDSPSLLEANVPAITQAYITSRLESVSLVLSNGALEDMLDNEEQLTEQLDALPYLVRFQYDKSAAFISACLTRWLRPSARSTALPANQLAVLEGQLTWLVYIIGAIIRGRLSSSNAESQEAIDGDLAARVFGLLALADEGLHLQRYGNLHRQRLDAALLHFFQCFRKVYIGEQVMHSSKVYGCLTERLGLADHPAVLNVMLAKVAKNLSVYAFSEHLVFLTLQLFQDLSAGYMSGKLLMKLDCVAVLLAHHSSHYYAFLDHKVNSRNRTTFYATLARLLFMEEQPMRFRTFVAPLHAQLLAIAAAAGLPAGLPTGTVGLPVTMPNGAGAAALRAAVPAEQVIGLFRDLRGIAAATNSRRTYNLLFDWMYPAHFPTIIKCLEAWADVPAVTTPLLKFMAEFVFNKTTRLAFEPSSPNGILLFREVSKMIVIYGKALLGAGRPPPGANLYDSRYKGSWVCLLMLARAMSGSYVNFGVFELYGDPALKDALDMALRLVMAIPQADLLSYRKLSRAWFSLTEVLAQGHTGTLACQDSATFLALLTSLDQGLKSLDVAISSSCAAALDNLAAFYFKNGLQANADSPVVAGAREMEAHLRMGHNPFPSILSTLFEVVMFEECSNQWSLSRPMLSLILINEPVYNNIKAAVVASQPTERQAHLAACLDKLMADVGRNLEPKNRDKFTQNLTVVRHEYRSKA
ncbi:armadillo-type protein [Haematococcus lacustris]